MMTLPAMCFCCVDFQKVAALIHEFLLKLGDGAECAELRDALNLALFHLQRYYRLLQKRLNNTLRSSLQETFQVYGSTTFSQDPRDKFTWKWIDLEKNGISERHNPDGDRIPELLCASQMGDNGLIVQIIEQGSLHKDCINKFNVNIRLSHLMVKQWKHPVPALCSLNQH